MNLAEYTAVMGAVAATCAALTGVAGVLFALRVWWRNRGKDGLKNWIHETSGAAQVARTTAEGLAAVRLELSKSVEQQNISQQGVERLTEAHHRDNQIAISAVGGAQERTATALRTFVDDHMIEAAQRDDAIAKLNDTQERMTVVLEALAVELRAHTRSRKKHPTQLRTA